MKRTILGILCFILMAASPLLSQAALYKVSGKVTNEKTGAAVAKATVSFQLTPTVAKGAGLAPASTGPDGSYSINLPEGTYYLSIKHPNFNVYMQKEIKVSANTQLDFALTPITAPDLTGKAVIKGRVFFNADQSPVSGASVTAISTAGLPADTLIKKVPSYGASTGADGSYTLIAPPGEYYIACTYARKGVALSTVKEYYNDAKTIDKAEKITVAANAAVTGIDFGLDQPVSVVPAEVTISGTLLDSLAKPVKEAKLSVFDRITGKQTGASVKTDAAGKYTAVISLTKGQYELVLGVSALTFQNQYYSGKTAMADADVIKLNITGDKAELTNINFVLKASGGTGGKKKGQPAEEAVADNNSGDALNNTPGSVAAVKGAGSAAVTEYSLENNYPNPFNPSTKIRFSLPEASDVKIEVYTITGRKAATLVNESMGAGVHETVFDASGFPSGIYLYRMTAGSYTSVKVMQILK
ncbi:MAG: carboxypeptidase regulatory-like domain-containing protein [Syntrophothermus sp.]